jgi:sarcosine oxidase
MQTYDVAVIGLGAMGASALYALARRGVKAIGFDQFDPGHARGSSHGESRLIRLAYFEDPSYVPLVRLAYDAWARLEAAAGEQVLTRTGIIEAGVPGSALVAGSLRSAVENDIPHERLTGAQVAARFPAFTFPADWEGLYQADGGVLQPEKAIELYIRLAQQAGASVRANTRVLPPDPIGDRVIIRTEAGEVIEAGSVILAGGPWMTDLVPELAPHLTLSRQLLFWFDPRDKALVTPARMPAFLFDSGDDIVYGMPDLYGSGVKAASHRHGNTLASGDSERAPPTPEDARPIQDALARYIPAAFGPVMRSAACTYTNTADDHFVVGLHRSNPQIVIASPCSGHGFKFSSILGEVLADLAMTGETDKPIGLFDPRRVWG